jgi:alkylhydroperoxidase family enzyme
MLVDRLNLAPAEQLPQILTDRADAEGLSDTDRAVMDFAEQVARDAHSVTDQDVQHLRDLGLSDTDVLDVALAAAARCFFAKVLDAVGAQADRPISDALGPELSARLTVGRPVDTVDPTGP